MSGSCCLRNGVGGKLGGVMGKSWRGGGGEGGEL